jgi:hypothetical protein
MMNSRSQPPIQWVLWALSAGVKREESEADHSAPTSAQVNKTWTYSLTPRYVFVAWFLIS